jgi:uncharacterized repeat protein (TIGR02543 family)
MKDTYFSVKPGAKGSEFYGGGNSQGLSDQGTKYQGTRDQVPSGKGLSDQVPSTNYRATSVECSGNHPVITLLSPRNHPLLGSGGQVVTDRGEVLADRRGVLADRRGVLAERRDVVAMMRQKCMMWKYVAMLLAVLVLSVGEIWGETQTLTANATVDNEGYTTGSDTKSWTKASIVTFNLKNVGASSSSRQLYGSSSTREPAWQMSKDASNSPDDKYTEIKVVSGYKITSIAIRCAANGTTVGRGIAFCFAGDFSTDNNSVLDTVSFPVIANDNASSTAPNQSFSVPDGTRTVRLYKKARYDSTNKKMVSTGGVQIHSSAQNYNIASITVTYEAVASDAYGIHIGKNNADYTDESLTNTSGTTWSKTITLDASSYYEFKVKKTSSGSATWYGNDGKITATTSPAWDFSTGVGSNCKLYTSVAGSYTFSWDTSNDKLTITYPSGEHTTKRVYMVCGDTWCNASPKFFVHSWGVSDYNTQVQQNACGEYYADIIWYNDYFQFTRNASDATAYNNGTWKNYSQDLTYNSSQTKWTCTGWSDDKGTFSSSAYSPTTYTITFAGNSNTGGSMTNLTGIACGANQDITANAYTRTGYSFAGWKANVNVTIGGSTVTAGTLIDDEATIQNITENITLTAQWSVKSYDLTWNLGGGTTTSAGTGIASGVSANTTSSIAYGTSLSAPTVTKTGYDFTAWDPSVESTMPAEAATYTATWTAKTYTISYYDGGATDNITFTGNHMPSYPTSHTYDSGTTTLKKASKAGYVFGGWYGNYSCSGDPITSYGATDITSDQKLYAKWTAMNLTPLANGTLYTASDMVPDGVEIGDRQYYPGVSGNNIFNILGTGNEHGATGPLGSATCSDPKIPGSTFDKSLYFRNSLSISGTTLPTSNAIQFKVSQVGLLDIYCANPVELYLIKDGESAVQLDASETDKVKITKAVSYGTYYIYAVNTNSKEDDLRLYGLKFTPKYAITHSDATNGSYTIKVGSAAAVSTSTNSSSGETITLAATPSSGYVIDGWNVTGATVGNNNIALTTFTMPASDVTVAPTFKLMPNVYYYQDGTRYASSTYKTPKGEAASSGDDKTINSGNEWTVSNSISGLTVSAKGCTYDGKSGDIIYMTSYLKVPTGGDNSDKYVKFVVAAGYKATSLKMKIGGYSSNPTVTLKPYVSSSLGAAIKYSGTIGGVATTENNFNEISWSNLAAGTYYLNVSGQNAYISEITAQTESTGYVISFAGNGNTGGSTASHTAITSGADITLNSNGYTKTGYDFSHWTANVDVTVNSETVVAGDPIEDGATIENVTSNIELTAQWTIQTFDVTFAVSPAGYGTVSGNTIADVPYNTSISTSSNSVTINGSTITATAESQTAQYTYAFDSWSNASGNVTAARTITANFTRSGRSYTVTLNKDGGTINPSNNVTSYTYGVGATLPTDVTKSGYVFAGWYDNSGLTGDAVTTIADDATGNKEYWAKWTELEEICETMDDAFEASGPYAYQTINDVEYDVDAKEISTSNGVYLMTEAQHITAEDDHEYDNYMYMSIGDRGIIKEIKITVKNIGDANDDAKGIQYTFYEEPVVGNVAPSAMTTSRYSIGATETFSIRPSSGDNVAFGFRPAGTWIKIESICIYYEPSCTDPELGFESPSLTKYTGESVSNTLTNTHNVEVSYSSSNEAVATVNSSGAVTIKGVGTTTITATAAAQTVLGVSYCADAASYTLTVNPYTITYELNGGEWGEVSHKETYTKFDDGYDLPTPTKTDKTFLGWYENSEFTGDRVYILPAGSTGDKTYYAKWGSAVTATWTITDNEGGNDAFYKGGSGHHVKAVLDQDALDASGSADALDLSASEGVTLSSVTKGVYTSGDNNGKAYVEAAFSISGDIDEDEISFFLNVPAAGEYAAAELSEELPLNDCPIVVGSPIVISIFKGTSDGDDTKTRDAVKYKQDTKWTDATTGFASTAKGVKDPLYVFAANSWSSSNVIVGGTTYLRGIQNGGSNASENYFKIEVPIGYTATIYLVAGRAGGAPNFGLNKSAIAPQSGTHADKVWYASYSSSKVLQAWTIEDVPAGTYYLVGNADDCIYAELKVTLTPTSGVPGVPTTLSWSGSLADKAKVDRDDVDADFAYTATPSTNTIGAITYTSSDESVATVDGNGKVHIINEGPTTITATLAESGCYTGDEITYTLNVTSTCADVRGTIVAADGSAIAGNSIEKGACDTVTLKLTGYTDGATIQWQKNGEDISGANSAEYTVPTDGAGVYTAVTRKNCDLTSNSVTVTSASSTIEPTIFADEFTVKSDRPFEYRLMQLNEGETCTFESATNWINDHDFKITTEGNIVTIKGYIGIKSNSDETITLTISNGCSSKDKDILIHATPKSAKPMIAWIATGDKGVKDNVLADQSTNTDLYKALVAKDKYALTPRNCYWTTDEKELIKEYSKYDLVILTDYPNSRKGPNSEDDRSKSYTNALGLLIDRVPMLTFEAFVAGCPNWGLSSNPENTNSTQNSLTLLCNANDIFAPSNDFNAGASVEVGTATEGQQALQGFELDAMPNFVFIAKITDGGRDYVTCCERQVNTTARMMVFGLNQNLMNAITKTGEDMVAGFVDYLLLDETASIPDCSVIFKGTEETGGTDWSNTSNWEGASLPNPYASVRIDAPCVVGDGVTAKAGMIKIHTGSEGGYTYTGSLTIQPQGRMIVENGVYRVDGTNYATYLPTEPNNLVINADADHTGALIFSNPRGNTQATVYLYSKATTSENTCWQYVGIPFGSLSPAVSWFYNAWMMKYTTGTTTGDDALYSWEYINNYDVLNGFQGYALTQTAAKSYQLQGGLAPTTDKVLAVSNAGGNGWNLYANSWTAPIHIDKMEASDFVNADATIYLYNTGSADDWKGSTLDETGTSTTAGQYLAVPVGLAEYTGTKYIPSMQGFFVQGNHASAAGSVRLRYDAVVRDTTVMADLNTPLRTPSRETVSQEPEHVTMVVRGEKYTDVLHLFRSDEWSAGYENGYDAHKVDGDDYTPQLYAVTGKEELAVVATDEWEGTVLNFRAGSEDGEYTIFFRYNESEAEALYLYDLTTETYTRIENGGSYHFSTTDKETHPRFILTYNAPSVATGTGDVQRDDVQSTKARKVLLDNHVYIFRNGKLYDSTGKMVK